MSSVLEKSLALVELLADYPAGLSVSAIAQVSDQPASGVHRTLNELMRLGYVRQVSLGGDYALSIKLPAMGLGFLGRAGVTDVTQPILDRLAAQTGELIRMSVIEQDRLTWVAVAQGATRGLRYDPGQEQGVVVHLASSAGGQAWLAALPQDEALQMIARQGLAREAEAGVTPPVSLAQMVAILDETRRRGYSIAINSYILGMAAMATTVQYRGTGPVMGCLSVAGPAARLTQDRMAEFAPLLHAAAEELGKAAVGSRYFQATMRLLDAPEDIPA